ncbi:hypothetical protein DFQ27_002147 [Actinomortierella ambigua]|uniref:Coth-domain-containing protein n=1 Tax=Actinomortierella ambigua TaxID=1343610 RepID=A0A9P6Q845_9FUNG|nr:hypothetical protein DFQ27_002147 [Actinomortierella ambigua]
MLGSSNARARMVVNTVLLSIIFLFSVIIIGIVGVNGRVTSSNLRKVCLLYVSQNNGVARYNDAYCLMPMIGSAVVAFFALIFLIALVIALTRHKDFFPRAFSVLFMVLCALLSLLAFAICGEIGIGLNKSCSALQVFRCRSQQNFSALYAAEIMAGIVGGLWIFATIFEIIQFKRIPGPLGRHPELNPYGSSGYQTIQPTVRPKTSTSLPESHHTDSAQAPEAAYDHTYAQRQAYVSSPHHQPPLTHTPTPGVSVGAGPKAEFSETLNPGDKMRFNVVGFPNTENGSFGVKIGTSVTKLITTVDTFPLWSGIVPDATESVEYKYVKLDDAGSVVEEESFVRHLTQAKVIKNKETLNEFFQRETTIWTLPNVPQVYERELPSQSNALEAEDQIATIHITVAPERLDTILKTPMSDLAHEPVPVHFCYINDNKILSLNDVAMKISGKSSMEFNKQAFKFDFDDAKNQSFFHRQHIKLRSQTQDPTMMREKIYIDVLNAMGVPSQQGAWVRFYANKKPIGLYLMVDDISKSFLRQTIHHGDKLVVAGSLIQMNAPEVETQADLIYKGPTSATYPNDIYKMANLGSNPPTDPLHQLIQFMQELQAFNPQATTPDPIAFWQDRIDLDGFLRNMAMEYLAGSWDAYWYSGSNYFMYFNPTLTGNPSSGANSKIAATAPPGRWQWISTDFDGSFGNGDPTDTLTTYDAWVPAPSFTQHDRPMVTKVILKCPVIREQFERILRETVGWCFKPDGLFPRIDVYEKMLAADVAWDYSIDRSAYPGKNNLFTINDFHNSIKGPVEKIGLGIRPWIEGRTKDLQAQLSFAVQAGAPDRVPRPVRHKKKLDGSDDSGADVVSEGVRRSAPTLWMCSMLTTGAAYAIGLLMF